MMLMMMIRMMMMMMMMTLKEEQQWLDSWGCLGLGAHWPPVSRNVPVVNDNDNCYDNYTNTQTQD